MKKSLLSVLLFTTLGIHAIKAQLNPQWESTISGNGDFGDRFNAVAVDANDNYYVTGYTVNPNTDRDIIIAKYNSNSQLQWRKVFGGTGNGPDEGKKILIHPNGNILMCGYVNNKSVGNDFYTVMLKDNGDTVWTRSFNSPNTNLYDEPNAITIDAQGNIIITGDSDRDPSPVVNNDYLTVKYNSSGSLQWFVRYNSNANNNDRAMAVVCDPSNNIYVTGRSFNGGDDDYVTIKYSVLGAQQWAKTFDNGGDDRPTSMGIDKNNNIYVAGRSNNGTDDDYRLVQYSTAGTQLFSVFYDVAGQDRPVDMVVVPSGGCIITGRSDGNAGTGIDYDIHTVAFTSTGTISWVGIYKGAALNDDIPTSIAFGLSGSVVISGFSDIDNTANINDDIVLLQYSSSGSELVKQLFNGSGNFNDEGMDAAQLNNGNLVIVGNSSNLSNQSDAIALMYNTTSLLSQRTYSGMGDNGDNVREITFDPVGGMYYCGYTVNKDLSRDFTYGRIDKSGSLLWKKDTSGTLFGSDEEANAIAVDPSGNVIISGYLKNSGTSSDVYIEKVNDAGTRIWNFVYDSPISESDRANEIAVNNAGDIYVVGKSDVDATWQVNDDILVLKISSAGALLWKNTFASPTLIDRGQFAKLNTAGELFVVGQLQNGINDNVVILKYSTGGALIWSKTLDISGGNDKLNDVVIQNNGNIIITGQTQKQAKSTDYESYIACFTTSGQQSWIKFFGKTGDGLDEGVSLAAGIDNSIWLAGNVDSDTTASNNLDIFLAHYDSSGATLSPTPVLFKGLYSDEVDDLEIIDNGIPCIAMHSNTAGLTDIDYVMNLLEFKNDSLSISYKRDVSDTIDVANVIKWHNTSASLFVGGSTFSQVGQRDMLFGKYGRGTNSTYSVLPPSIRMYPNPAENEVRIESHINGTLNIMNLAGQVIFTNPKFHESTTYSIDISDWMPGMYILEISNEKEASTSLFLKK